jgi:hypothetical protein
MNKADNLKQARIKRDTEREMLKTKELPLAEYQAERKRINDEYVAVLEANKPTHHRISTWQREDNARFEHWLKMQVS